MNIYKDPYQKFPKLHPLELRGVEGMTVNLIDWPANAYKNIMMGQSASWRPWKMDFEKGEIVKMLQDMASGKVWMGNVFEGINFTFAIKNISRACTHQLVRTRIGAGFMQESGREGKWHQAPFITPLTILEDEDVHRKYVDVITDAYEWYEEIQKHGIPPQDARSAMPHAVAQNMWMTINFRALLEFCAKRLCTTMQWEINTLARQLRDEVTRKFPHLGILIKSNCERSGGCKSITPYYQPGAENNGNKVYFEYEGDICGKASNISEQNIKMWLDNEIYNF